MILETERLRIRPADREWMEACIAIETDPELLKAYTEMLNGCLGHPDKWEWYAMWVIEQKDGTPIGDLCFKGLPANGVPEIGYGLREEYWGRGYATEAVRRFLRYLFEEKGLQTVYASFFTGNEASRRVMEKCGMTYRRVAEKELTYLGVERDLTYYAIRREESAAT